MVSEQNTVPVDRSGHIGRQLEYGMFRHRMLWEHIERTPKSVPYILVGHFEGGTYFKKE